MKWDKDTDEEAQQKRGVSMEISKVGKKERSPEGLSLPNQKTILIYIRRHYFKRYGKNKIKLIKTKMDLNNRKMHNHPPSPVSLKISPYPSLLP